MQAALHSGLYFGVVRHRRFDAVRHGFSVRLYLAYLDLAELEPLFAGRWFWSAKRWAPMRFRREDYFGSPALPLADAVRDEVGRQLGARPDGPVRLLTNLRAFGYVQNPVSIYYCFDRSERLVGALAEITNTPWGERHHYVLGADAGRTIQARTTQARTTLHGRFQKQFHVSPFQPMEQDYEWAIAVPGERLAVHMQNRRAGAKVFDATLLLQRAPWTTGNLTRALLRHPWMTAKVALGIYWHAFRLWWKRAPFHTHPKKRTAP